MLSALKNQDQKPNQGVEQGAALEHPGMPGITQKALNSFPELSGGEALPPPTPGSSLA